MIATPDLLVVGGGITGLGVARAAAEAGLAVTLLERQQLGGIATQVSGAIIRTHYDQAADALLALEGLESFEQFADDVGGDAGFRRTGFIAIPDPVEVADGSFSRRVAMLRAVGVATELVDGQALGEIAPGFAVDDVRQAAFEPRSGYADPALTTGALAAAARRAGATVFEGVEVQGIKVRGGRVIGITTERGGVAAPAVVLACGAWAIPLAAGIGVELPIRPTAAIVACFSASSTSFPIAIDVPNGVYLRPDGARGSLVGRRDWNDRPIAEADGPLPQISDSFAADVRDRAARRLPEAAGWRPIGGRSGPLDMTPDGRPLLGPAGPEGLWLSVGWSGTGFKTGISAGRSLARWIVDGEPARPEYAELRPGRPQLASGGLRTPH